MASENAKAVKKKDRKVLEKKIKEKLRILEYLTNKDIPRNEEIEMKLATNEENWRYYIYIIKCNEFYKIGIANDLDSRISSLQTGNPYILEIYFAKKHRLAEQLEKYLHNHFIKKQISGEWFKLNENDLKEAKNIITIYGNPTAKKSD